MDASNLDDALDEAVEEGQGHERQASPSALSLVKLGQGVSGPFTSFYQGDLDSVSE
jgi:hypothetical protein